MQPKTGLPKDCNINHNQSSNPQFLENLPHPKPYNGITLRKFFLVPENMKNCLVAWKDIVF